MPRKAAPPDESLKPVILAAAAKLLTEPGGSNFTMKAIANIVGIAAPSIYHHYKSRSALITELIRQGLKTFSKHVGSQLNTPNTTPGERVRACVEAHVLYEYQYSDFARAFDVLFGPYRLEPATASLRKEFTIDDDMRNAFNDWDKFASDLLAVIEEGTRDGYFKIVNSELAASAVISLADGVLLWMSPSRLMTIERIAESYGEMALHMLQYSEPTA